MLSGRTRRPAAAQPESHRGSLWALPPGQLEEAGVIWVTSSGGSRGGIQLHPAIQACEKVQTPQWFLHVRPAFWSPRLTCEHGRQHGVAAHYRSEDMENHLVIYVCSVDYGILLIFTSLSLFFLVTVLVLFWCPFPPILHIIFSFYCGFIPFFLILFFGSPLLFPHTFGKKIHCMCLFFFYFPFFLFLFSTFFLFTALEHKVVTQKNLSGLVPRPRLKARPQPPLFYPFTCSEPQFTDCVALSEHSIPGGQIALQMSVLMKN